MDQPIGMKYEEARKKAKHFAHLHGVRDEAGRASIIRSITRQARLCEGEGAEREIIKEIGDTARSFSGIGNRQVGVGDGNKLGDGRYIYKEGKWERRN